MVIGSRARSEFGVGINDNSLLNVPETEKTQKKNQKIKKETAYS
jgi:ABC-type lipoprotein release transport system permease subunit